MADLTFESFLIDDPMEIYRFCVKMLRREINALKEHHLFQRQFPSYSDLVTSSFELRLIPTAMVDELSELEEIWNPKKCVPILNQYTRMYIYIYIYIYINSRKGTLPAKRG